jgi:uncharacterized protein YcbK (DUF882 family)
MFGRIFLIALLVGFVAPAVLDVGEPAAWAKKKKKKSKKNTKVKVCTERTVKKNGKKKKKKSCEYVAQFSGHNAPKDTLRTEPLERPSGNVWVWSQNLHQEVQVNIYAADGSFDEAALAQLDDVFRCRRSYEVRAVDPRLYEQLSRIQDHFESARVELVSGFRYKERSSSRHYHASAMDIKFQGVSIKDLYAYAQTLDLGGMGIGIYPNSGFVHVDYRAPGEPSYRWTDRSYPGSDGKATEAKKHKPRKSKAKRPNS